MGSGHSKASKEGGKKSSRAKTSSPNQEKHNSADSKAPLTEHAAGLAFPRPSSLDRCASFNAKDTSRSRSRAHTTDNSEVQKASLNPTTTPIYDSQRTIQVHDIEGHSNVSRPPRPPRLRHLSELIDPEELTIDSHIRSPSGNLLAPEQFLVHPNRPRSIRERQDQIREKVRAASRTASRLGVEAENAEGEKPPIRDATSNKKSGELGCFGLGCFS